jgi:hypothetical protein
MSRGCVEHFEEAKVDEKTDLSVATDREDATAHEGGADEVQGAQ